MFFKAHPWLWLAIGFFLVSTWAHLDDYNHGIIKARGLQGVDQPEHAFDARDPKKSPSKPNTPKPVQAPATTKVQAPPPVTTKKVDVPTTSKAQVPTTTPVVTSAKLSTSSAVLSTSKSSSSSTSSTSTRFSSSSSSRTSSSSTSTGLTTSTQTISSSTILSSSISAASLTTARSSSASVTTSSSISGSLSTTIKSSSASATISSSATGASTDTTVVQSSTGSVSSQSSVSTASVSTAVSTTTALSSSSDATAATAATAAGTQSSNSLSSGSTTATETGVITSSSSVTGSLTTGLTTTFTSSGNATAKITASRTHTSTTTGNGTTSATSTATRISQQKCAPGAGGKCSGTLCTLGRAVNSDDSDTTDTAKRAAENEFHEPLLLDGRELAVTARGYPISFSRRAFLDPTKYVDFETLSNEPNVKDLSTFGASDSDWVNFGTAKQSAFVDGLIGCSVVTIVSPTGFRSFHLWEYPGYKENTGTLEIDPATTLYSGGTNMEHLRKRLAALSADLESAKAKAGDGARVHIMMPRANVKASTIGAKWRYNTDKIFAWTKGKTKYGKFDLTNEVAPPARVAETIIDAVKEATGIEPEMCDYYPVKTVPKGQPYRGRWVLQFDPTNTAGDKPRAVNIWCEKDSQFDDSKALTW